MQNAYVIITEHTNCSIHIQPIYEWWQFQYHFLLKIGRNFALPDSMSLQFVQTLFDKTSLKKLSIFESSIMGNKGSKNKKSKALKQSTENQIDTSTSPKNPTTKLSPTTNINHEGVNDDRDVDDSSPPQSTVKDESNQNELNTSTCNKPDTQLLIYGYCHEIENILTSFDNSIPIEIINLCLTYYQITAIINIGIGQCGTQLTTKFYESILNEYNINLETRTRSSNNNNPSNKTTYLCQDSDSLIRSRCITIDLETSAIDMIKSSPINNFISENNKYFGNKKSSKSQFWAKAYYSQGPEIINDAMNIVRKEIENYDEPQAIQFMHSIAGGTGEYNKICTFCLVE